MRKNDHPRSYRPGRHQELLLKAALLRGEQTLSAWRHWKSTVDLGRIDHESARLLPLLYKNLSEFGVTDPLLERFKGAHRKAWYKNRVLIHILSGLIGRLQEAGLRPVVLKGVPMTLLYYRDYGLRPMDDVDMLVTGTEALRAATLLQQWGWQPRFPGRIMRQEIEHSCRHAIGFMNAGGHHVDLHWHLLPECTYPHADDDFLAAAIPISLDGSLTTLALCPADQLLHTVVHGVRWSPQPVLRWVADAMTLLGSEAVVDWERLRLQVKERKLLRYLQNGMDYLHTVFQASVPQTWMEELRSTPATSFEKREYVILSHHLGLLSHLAVRWFQYSRFMGDTAFIRKIVAIPRYLKTVWDVKSWWRMPWVFVSKVSGALAKIYK
jgi:hypothetical protein